MGNLLTTREAAERLGLSRRQVSKLINQGKIQATRFGRDWQVDETSVEAYKGSDRKVGRPPKNEEKPG